MKTLWLLLMMWLFGTKIRLENSNLYGLQYKDKIYISKKIYKKYVDTILINNVSTIRKGMFLEIEPWGEKC